MRQFDFTKEYILENEFARLIRLIEEQFLPLKSISRTSEIWTCFLENGCGEENFQTYFQAGLQQRENQKEYPFAVFDKLKKKYAGMTCLYDYHPNLESIKLASEFMQKILEIRAL